MTTVGIFIGILNKLLDIYINIWYNIITRNKLHNTYDNTEEKHYEQHLLQGWKSGTYEGRSGKNLYRKKIYLYIKCNLATAILASARQNIFYQNLRLQRVSKSWKILYFDSGTNKSYYGVWIFKNRITNRGEEKILSLLLYIQKIIIFKN